jgi:hypothetical protein
MRNGWLFRDRDFDAPVPNKPSLTQERYTYYSYRTTIENYLFDSQLFDAFLKEKGLNLKYKLSNPAEVQQVFIKAAQKIAYYQAIRHTMGKMRIPTDFGTTWIQAGSGTLPTSDELDNPTYCRQRALEKMAEAKQQTDVWTEATFDSVLNEFYSLFSNDTFYQNLDFLIWFQGKDFAKSLSAFLPEFPMKTYYKFAKTHFDYTQFADLMEIRKILESYVSAL